MVHKIENILRYEKDLLTYEQISDKILRLVEDYGMLPPSKRLSFEEYNAMAYVIDSKSQYKEVHKWEE